MTIAWLRQAGAALIGVIPVLMVSHAFGGYVLKPVGSRPAGNISIVETNAGAIVPLTEQSKSGLPEPIFIVNLSPNVQKPAFSADVFNLDFGEDLPLRPHHFG